MGIISEENSAKQDHSCKEEAPDEVTLSISLPKRLKR